MEEEIWKIIPGYEKYEASSLGNIQSNWFGKTTYLKPQMHVTGYYQINLRKDKKKVTLKVHQLVAMTFLNHVPCGMDKVIDHINEIKTDNRLVNLQILTTRENVSKSTKSNSIYPGVSKRKNDSFYETKIKHNGKLVYLGIYKDELEAAKAYTNYLKIINMTLSDLFNARKTAIDFTDGQKQALNKVYKFLQSDDTFFLLAGYSGCGKTTIAENIANATKASLLAPTNAAVNRIKEKINNDLLTYSTIHGALFAAGDKKNTFYLDKSLKIRGIYIIDECSMIDKYVLEVLIKQATEKRCKIIFMGDSFQLEPVGENPYIFNWEKSYPDKFLIENKYELTEVKRYDGTLLKIATEMRINKKASFIQPEESDLSLVRRFSKSLATDINNGNNYVVITSTNEKRVKYNEKIRSYLFRDKEINMYAQNKDTLVAVSNSNLYSNGEIFSIDKALLVEEFEVSVEDRKDNMKSYTALLYRHHGQMTLLIPNLVEASLHGQQIIESIKNGYTVVSNKTYEILVKKFQPKNSNARYFLNKDVTIATYGYAISCHKAQGQEWDNVYIDAEWLMPVWDNAKWFYTAITRAKCKVEVTQNKYLKMV